MSWSSSYPPPPRRSRSRSPRGSYFPRDSGYPPDSFRDWEYDRDRNWPGYDRGYDYGRRGRSRSPMDETGRKRRRSPSPYDRDRYEPRPRYSDDYDAHSRGYGHSPTRRSGLPPGRRPPPDPHTFDYPASLKQYAEWFRYFYPQQAQEEDNADKAAEQEANDGSKPRNGIKSKWEKYKKDFAATQLQTMFDHHKKSPWFWEKYNPAPEFTRLRTRVRKEGWTGRLGTFLHDLESGKFDPDLNEPEIDPPSPVKENVSNGETSTSETNKVDEPKALADDDMPFNMDAEDDVVDNDNRGDTNGKAGGDSKRSNRGEEIAVPPEGNQVMIRTIPPDIGRVKLEESIKTIPGFIYLALGDPLQKRNYYRAGWLRFTDDADMSTVMTELQERKIEGFKLHVSHNTKPFVNRIRYAPEVANRPERMEKDLANAKILATILEDEATKLLRTKMESLEVPKPEDEDMPMEDNQENEEGDEEEPAERGSDAVDRRVEKVMTDMREQGLVDPSDETAYENKKTEVALDLYIAYLRAAFHACYYCSVVTDHLEELQRKCVKHVRKPLSKAPLDEKSENERDKLPEDEQEEKVTATEKERDGKKDSKRTDRADDRWLEWLDSKIALLINRDSVDPREYGGKNPEDELSKIVEPHIKQEDEGKFRCRTCQKLFKATSFVEKHIANKHPELVKALEDIPYFNNFALDPHRIQPFAHPPPAVGNSQQAPPQAFGIQVSANDYSRHGQYHPGYPPTGYGAPPPGNGYWAEHYPPKGYYYEPSGYPGPLPPRRDEGPNSRRLSDRISGYADIPANAGLPPKPPPSALDSALSSGNGAQRKGRSGQPGGPPPPPPPDAKEDPRAAAGKRISYHDMDLVAEGDVELSY